jgi:hypothetical protein
MRFFAPRPSHVTADAPPRSYLAGQEGIPWECRVTWKDGLLLVEREERESGILHFPWHVRGRGELMLCSASLMERARPYNLPVELARGTINRVRNQACVWQGAGMIVPASFDELVSRATLAFTHAATNQVDPPKAADFAEQAIELGVAAAELLGGEYTQQVLAIRRSQQTSLGTLLGCKLSGVPGGSLAKRYLAAFNTAVVSPAWREIEATSGTQDWDTVDRQMQWCKDHSYRVIFGPLLQLHAFGLPDWLYLWQDEFEDLHAMMMQHVESVVSRYRGRVHLWHVASRVNLPGVLELSEEQRLKLTVDAIDRVRQLDARTPTIVSFDQPLAEYIATEDQELTPIHFADTLVRGELGLAGIGLEMNWGFSPGGTQPRDVLELSKHLDRWTHLGLPLVAFLTSPSSGDPDPQASPGVKVLPQLIDGGVTLDSQKQLVDWLLPLLLAKQSVQAIVLNQLGDKLPHEFPHAGLFDANGRTKPALLSFANIRKEWVG